MMSKEKADKEKKDIFNVDKIRELAELMKENDMTIIEIEQGTSRIRIRRGGVETGTSAVAMPLPEVRPLISSIPVAAPAVATPVAESVDAAHFKTIDSPMVGTFYTASNPNTPSFVKVGDVVGPEKTVCIIEAMKVFNEIQAEISGKIVAVLVKNGDSVDFGKPLFKVDIRG